MQQSRQGIDLVGVSLADLVRVYLERVDDRPYVACAQLVEDTRLVSLRSDPGNLREAIMGVLRRHGYEFQQSGSVTYVCPLARSEAASAGVYGATPETGSQPGPLSAPQPDDQQQPAVMQTPFASFAAGGKTLPDRLSSLGYEPAGCVATDRGVRLAMKSGNSTFMVDMTVVRKSQIAPLVQCRI